MTDMNFSADPTRPSQPGESDDAQLQRELAEAMGGQDMEQLMQSSQPEAAEQQPKQPDQAGDGPVDKIENELRRGRIAAIQGDDVFVEMMGVPGKNQGVVPLTQFERAPRVGSIMDFVVVRDDPAEGLMILSREGAVSRATWSQLTPGTVVEVRVVATNKGGLEVEMAGGIPAFMPASQVDLHYVESLEPLVGEKLEACVQEINRKSKKVVVSRRQHLQQQRERKQKEVLEQLAEDQTRKGVVSSLTDYGAFVDLGGVDGMIHISDLSYAHVKKPSDVVQVGQHVEVKVLKLDRDKQRIRLGLKQVMPDPWAGIDTRYRAGDQVSGRVVRVADFGAFIELEEGVEGLLPVSEMSWRRIHKPSEVAKPGDVLRLAVLQVDPDKRRISLSLKQAQGDPWADAAEKYARNTLIQGKVLSTTDFGAFVELEAGVEGLVHISELSDRRVASVEEVLKPGDQQQFRVLGVDTANRRISLSLKAVARELPADQPQAPAASARPASQRRKPTRPLKGGLE